MMHQDEMDHPGEGAGGEDTDMAIPVTATIRGDAATRSDDSGPSVLAFQPVPLAVMLSQSGHNGVITSGITRIWTRGDTLRCNLCPTCTANHEHGVCTIQVTCPVPATKAALGLFSARALNWAVVRQRDRADGLD